MASQQPYIDLDTLKAYLNIAVTNDSQDVFLTTLITTVQAFIDRFTNRTFGWGDAGDSVNTDYSSTDSIGVVSASLAGNLLTVNTMGPMPWVAEQNVSLYVMPTLAWNGVWKVTQVNNPTQLVVDISVSKGTLSLSDQASIANNGGLNANGYIGNYVQNYRFQSQDSYDGLVGKTIYLRNMDIRSIDSLYIGARNVAEPSLLDHTQYVWRDDGRVILGGAYFNSYNSGAYSDTSSFYGTVASGYQTITVSYWYGYVGVPPELQLAALDICTAMYTLRKSLGMLQEKVGDYEVRYDIAFRKALANQPDSLNTLNVLRRVHM